MQCLNRRFGDWSTCGHGSARSPASSSGNGSDKFTASDHLPSTKKRQIPWEGPTDGDEQFLRPPDPRENIDQTLLAPHIPSPLLLPTTIAIE